MTYSHLDPAMQNRIAWHAGKTVGTKRPLTQTADLGYPFLFGPRGALAGSGAA